MKTYEIFKDENKLIKVKRILDNSKFDLSRSNLKVLKNKNFNFSKVDLVTDYDFSISIEFYDSDLCNSDFTKKFQVILNESEIKLLNKTLNAYKRSSKNDN